MAVVRTARFLTAIFLTAIFFIMVWSMTDPMLSLDSIGNREERINSNKRN
jgi:hypothetical protein